MSNPCQPKVSECTVDCLLREFWVSVASTSPDSRALFEGFYEEVFTEIDEAYGKINQMHVCENMGEHLIGNVYIKVSHKKRTQKACELRGLNYFSFTPNPPRNER